MFGYFPSRPVEGLSISDFALSDGDDSSTLYMKYFTELRRYVFTNFNSSDFTIHNWNLTSDYTAWDRWTVAGYSLLSSIAYEKSGDVKYLFEAKFFVDGLLSKVDSSSQSIIIYPYQSPPRYGWLFADCDWIWAMQKLNEHLQTSYNVTDRVDKILMYAVENSTDLWWRYNYVTGTENYMTPNTYSHMLGLLAYLTSKGVKDYSSQLQKLYYSHEKSRTSNGLYSYNYPPLGTGTVSYTPVNVFGLLVGYNYHPSVFNATKIQGTLDYYASYNNYAQVHWAIPTDAGMYALGTSLGFNIGDRFKNAFLRMYNQFDVGGANATNRNLERGMFWLNTFTKAFNWYFSATMPLPALAFVDSFVIPTMTYSATESSNTWYLSNSWNNDSEIWFDYGTGGNPFWTALRMKLLSNEFLDAVHTYGLTYLDLPSVTANGTHYTSTATVTNLPAYTVTLAQDYNARQFQICFNTTNSATYVKYHWYNYTTFPYILRVFFPNGTSVDINNDGTYTLDNYFVIKLHDQKWRFIKTDNKTFTFTKLLGGTSYNQLKTQAKNFLIYRFDLYRATTSTTVETWFKNALEYFNQHGKTALPEPINMTNINPHLVSSGIGDNIMLFSQGSVGLISSIVFNRNTLSFTVTASSGITSTTQVYCGSKGEPSNVTGAMSSSYDNETKIATINVLHTSSKEITVYFEHTPPTTDINLSGVLGNNDWFTSEVNVALSTEDDSSGVDKTEYSFDNDTWTTYTMPFSVSNEGFTNIYYKSTDKAGNVETIKNQTIKIDETPPSGSITINSDDAFTSSTLVELTLTATDAISGVSKVRLSNDGEWNTEPWETPSQTKTWTLPSGDGTKIVYVQFMDNAGLLSSSYQDAITLDTIQPTTNAGIDQTVAENIEVTFNGSASWDENGITSFTWMFTDVTTKTLTGEKPVYTFNMPGNYTITLKVTDAAGNWATDIVIITVVDITYPVANAGQNRTVNVGTTVTFDARDSTDNVGIVSFEWDFGDETTARGITATHTYTNPGSYIVTLTVKDAVGNLDTHAITVIVFSPSTTAIPIWIVGAAIATASVAATAMLLLRKRK